MPVNELGGVRVVDVDGRDKSNNGIGIGPDGGMALTTGTGTGKEVEVGLMELIEGGRGKREKRGELRASFTVSMEVRPKCDPKAGHEGVVCSSG